MVAQLNFRATRSAVLAMALLMSPTAMAIESTTRELTQNLRAVESLAALGKQMKVLVSPDLGFGDDDIRHWSAAVDAAFAPELLEADFLEALNERLSEQVSAAALAFNRSTIGQTNYTLVTKSSPLDEEAAIKGGQEFLENAPEDVRALVTGIYEAQSGAERANLTMDIYFRAMAIAAQPIFGQSGAEQWVASAQYLRDAYNENYFSMVAGIYGKLENDELTELASALGTADMIAFGEVSTAALGETMNAAVDRLELSYAEELAGN